jgi:hypothetical protein
MINTNNWTDPAKPGVPFNREQDSEGHVVRVDGCIDVYRWSGANQWFEDRKGRWVAPDQFEDSDEWLGQIITPEEVAACEQAARREGMEEAARIVETDQWARKPKHIAAAIRAAAENGT